MINYEIKKDAVNFSQDFSLISVKFSYTDSQKAGVEFFGEFTCTIDWGGYFVDPIISRFNKLHFPDNWLQKIELPNQLNDIYYNKLVEYMVLIPESLEIDDKENIQTNYYTDEQEEEIYETLFTDLKFIEEFKDGLNNPAKNTLLTALLFFKKQHIAENKLSYLIKSIIREGVK
jgi:hypothetical protein